MTNPKQPNSIAAFRIVLFAVGVLLISDKLSCCFDISESAARLLAILTAIVYPLLGALLIWWAFTMRQTTKDSTKSEQPEQRLPDETSKWRRILKTLIIWLVLVGCLLLVTQLASRKDNETAEPRGGGSGVPSPHR